ncbi:ATP-binding protein [Streptomyces acidiscabies]|uniref:ATP-binding protein n=1 Tax=Streptomyces acidiscabies TaxID=42234 RepID=UPI00067DC931|nr:ATP-binding protein [Streptomyces acidiscabies]
MTTLASTDPVWERILLANERAPSAARDFAKSALPAHVPPEAAGDFVLVVSELVTNSVRYGTEPGDSLRVVFDFSPELLRVEVHDTRRRPPRFKPESKDRQRGRGLFIVDAIAEWGVSGREFGKIVWAEVKAS